MGMAPVGGSDLAFPRTPYLEHERHKSAMPTIQPSGSFRQLTSRLATENAGDVEAAIHLLAKASMWPEFKFQILEATNDRCVGKTTEGPWHKRWKEQGLDMDTCGAGIKRAAMELPAANHRSALADGFKMPVLRLANK